MNTDQFVHLHVHSNFSFLDGATPPERLVERAAQLEMPVLALTDHHGLYGAVRFLQAASIAGVRPIIGLEIDIVPTEPNGSSARPPFHLLLLARDRTGYSSLCRIITKAQLDYQDNPKITLDDLAPLAKNVIALSGCTRSEVISALPARGSNDLSCSVAVARRYAETFGLDSFWIELQHHLLPGDDLKNQQLVEIAQQAGLGYVITNNVHYATREEYRLRDIMACMQTNTTLDDWTDIRHRNAEYYLKSAAQMRQTFRTLPNSVVEAGLRASIEIAEQCDMGGDDPQSNTGIPQGESLLATATRAPSFETPNGETPFSYLYALCNAGLQHKYHPLTPKAVKRLNYELEIVNNMDLSEFFLCVWDMVQFSRKNGIRCAGRGSAADSIIAYVLDITTVDPLANNLLFDRFLNPGRVGMPDVDIDFDSRRRDEVIEYVQNKYGPDHSAMVANLITYKSRSAFRDVAKAMGYPPGLIDHIAASLSYRGVKHIQEDLLVAGIEAGSSVSVDGSDSSTQRTPHADTERIGQLETVIALCEQLDGYPRHLSLHNGGMLITREPLVDIVPIEYATSGVRVCQFNKDDVEALGLIKFDILGLRTLSIIDEALTMIKETKGKILAIDDLPLDDDAVYDFICTSKTIGVFQIESPGQWNLLQRAQPRTFGDLIIQIALFRPGPLQGGMVDPYIERRCGRESITYMHPSLEDALRDTLGVVIFQEQVLQVAHDFAGLSYADADGLRRAMSHYRSAAEMDVCREAFVETAVGLGRDRTLAEEMYEKITYFSGYGFCRSHAAAFAKTVYQTAYLKCYYPAYILAAILSNEPCCYYPTQTVIEEARKWDIEVLPIDINRSRARYYVETNNSPAQNPRDLVTNGGPPPPRSMKASRSDRYPAAISAPQHTLKFQDGLTALESVPSGRTRLTQCQNVISIPSPPPMPNHPSIHKIRMGFLQVKGVSEDAANNIVTARQSGPFRNLTDFWWRTAIDRDAIHNLVAVGAFDSLGVSRRKLLWQLAEVMKTTTRTLKPAANPTALPQASRPREPKPRRRKQPNANNARLDLTLETGPSEPIPDFPPLTELDLAGLDMTLQNASARYSVMQFYRRSLREAHILSIGEVLTKPDGAIIKTAGIVISRQKPPTAKGMTFLVLSDEEGELPAAIPPQTYESCRRTLNSSASLVVEGTLQRYRKYVSLMIKRMWNLQEIAVLDNTPHHIDEIGTAADIA